MDMVALEQLVTLLVESELSLVGVLSVAVYALYKAMSPILKQYLEQQNNQLQTMVQVLEFLKDHARKMEAHSERIESELARCLLYIDRERGKVD